MLGESHMEIRVISDIGSGKGLTLYSYGHESCSPDKCCVKVKRPRYVLHFVMYGKGYLSFGENRKVALSKGNVFLLYRNETYSYEPDKQIPWTYSWLTIDGDNLDELFMECGFTKDKPYLHLDNFGAYTTFINRLVNSYGVNIEYYFERLAYMLMILSRMLQQNKKRMDMEEEKIEKKRSFRAVVSYIRDNYMNELLDAHRISSSVFLSESYVKHLFVEMTGMSLTEFVNRYRIAEACVLYKQSPEMNGMQIAKKVGYNNYTYFVRLFKKYCLMSPQEYKKAETESDPFEWVKETMLYVFNSEEIDWLG